MSVACRRNRVTEWHRAYIQNAYRELARGTTRNQLDTLNINATRKRVLDVGCGPGNLLVALSTDTPELLVGVDVDAIFLTAGRSRIGKLIEPPSAQPALLRASLPILPFADASFDLVTCFLVMPHVPDDTTALTELARVLKPGGTLAISGHGVGFPLRYLKRFKLKPLQMYLASLIYRCTGKKWIRNTLQNDKKICDILKRIGMVPEMRHYNKKVLGCVATYWIKAIKSEVSPKATQ
ncbi:class I SAM-dependent methyltransferase [Candidatus Poribacteria bacterium]|nr:class I SAM-dependent methyltransferase [Candidatus Poribacteria bacterium]MYA58207.1 class I SAM-dependent methyltransferase [Candidatus Poribacteria bacterium]